MSGSTAISPGVGRGLDDEYGWSDLLFDVGDALFSSDDEEPESKKEEPPHRK